MALVRGRHTEGSKWENSAIKKLQNTNKKFVKSYNGEKEKNHEKVTQILKMTTFSRY